MSAPASDLRERLLPGDLLDVLRERAAVNDRENRFFDETLHDLASRDYLKLLVPRQLGGLGASLLQATRLQRRLAGADPAAALGVNMHLIVTGAARAALGRGLATAERVLRQAAEGELFAFGISEAGNDSMLFDSLTEATPDGHGGYRLEGVKIFTSMAHAWTRLVVHGKAAGVDGEEDEIVFGVLQRSSATETLADWNAHGMRGTDSSTTRLRGALLRAEDVLARTAVGPTQDPLRFSIFGCFELLLTSVYCGIGERAVQLAREAALKRRSATTGSLQADDPVTRRRAAAAIAMDGAALQLEQLARDFDSATGTAATPGASDHGPRWYLQVSGVKHRTTEATLAAVEQCVRASGGSHYYLGSELERLSRDARAGVYQPSDEASEHASYARALLGEMGAER